MIDIIDDFLSPGDFGHLQKTMIGAFFPWTISKIVDDFEELSMHEKFISA